MRPVRHFAYSRCLTHSWHTLPACLPRSGRFRSGLVRLFDELLARRRTEVNVKRSEQPWRLPGIDDARSATASNGRDTVRFFEQPTEQRCFDRVGLDRTSPHMPNDAVATQKVRRIASALASRAAELAAKLGEIHEALSGPETTHNNKRELRWMATVATFSRSEARSSDIIYIASAHGFWGCVEYGESDGPHVEH
jgi:hypothetical protein